LIIFSAASLTEAFTDLGQAFEAERAGTEVVLNFAGSQQLAQQLSQGAPADLFASADERQMTAVIETGRITDGSEQIFATNKLVVIFPDDNPGNLQQISDLTQPGLRLILAAPEVPVGQYAQEFLEKAAADPAYGPDFAEGVRGNIVSFEENVRAVLSKIVLGEADGGIVYQSDLKVETAASFGQLPIPEDLNVIATYPIAPIENSSQPALAADFLDFLFSPSGQAILARHGFGPPP
jgi:molybdate transport system substrate-binding protein